MSALTTRRQAGFALLALLGACATTERPPDAAATALAAAIADPERPAADRARDAARHPYATLQAFGLRPNQTVIEIAPGGGWYTEILAPYLRGRGQYVAAVYVERGTTSADTAARQTAAVRRFETRFGRTPARYGEIFVGTLGDTGLAGTGPPASADAVLTFRNIHNWIAEGRFDAALRAFHVALKPGGTLGVEEHRAPPGTSLERTIATGYVTEAYVVERARAAGFELVASSEVNANRKDDHDHPNGVWSLPPTLRGGAEGRDAFVAIGESDRMTLRFVKTGN